MENIKNFITVNNLKSVFFRTCFTAGFIYIGGICMYGLSTIAGRIFNFYPDTVTDYTLQFAACIGVAGVYIAFTKVLKDSNIIN
jgi:hypothetical protein